MVKYILLSTFGLILFSCVCGQTLNDLDEKRSFKSIKLGEEYSKFSSQLTLLGENREYQFKKYNFTPSESNLYNIFSVKMDSIILIFDKNNKLVDISLTKFYQGTNSMQDAEESSKSVRQSLIALFGKFNSKISINNSNELKLGVAWQASRTVLKDYWEDFGMNEGTKLFVTLTDLKFLDETFGPGF